jgi:hypothetical protein
VLHAAQRGTVKAWDVEVDLTVRVRVEPRPDLVSRQPQLLAGSTAAASMSPCGKVSRKIGSSGTAIQSINSSAT